ncbi:MAG: hypothetical protein Q8L39_08310 [Burkholderiales bacterium]|nr:hypothetical protein [Burkholderiales bacterium]
MKLTLSICTHNHRAALKQTLAGPNDLHFFIGSDRASESIERLGQWGMNQA